MFFEFFDGTQGVVNAMNGVPTAELAGEEIDDQLVFIHAQYFQVVTPSDQVSPCLHTYKLKALDMTENKRLT